MHMKAKLLAAVTAVLVAQVLLAQQFTPPALPAGAELVESEVVKVYSLDDQGAMFRAYAVKYKGSEVVASDTMGTSTHKVGDKIRIIVTRVEVPLPTGKHKGISFSIMPSLPSLPALPKKP
jgi:hypothetical protein